MVYSLNIVGALLKRPTENKVKLRVKVYIVQHYKVFSLHVECRHEGVVNVIQPLLDSYLNDKRNVYIEKILFEIVYYKI